MTRALFAALLATASLTTPAAAKTAFDGVWLFDKAPPTPGVTMMEVTSKGAKIEGRVTTLWYGPVEMMNPRIEDGKLLFEARDRKSVV